MTGKALADPSQTHFFEAIPIMLKIRVSSCRLTQLKKIIF
jgi:hypothetical protein